MKALFAGIAILFSVSACASAAALPNVVMLMGDDHGWEETGYHGHPHVKTPVLDEIAATGLRLGRFYSAHPSCSATPESLWHVCTGLVVPAGGNHNCAHHAAGRLSVRPFRQVARRRGESGVP